MLGENEKNTVVEYRLFTTSFFYHFISFLTACLLCTVFAPKGLFAFYSYFIFD